MKIDETKHATRQVERTRQRVNNYMSAAASRAFSQQPAPIPACKHSRYKTRGDLVLESHDVYGERASLRDEISPPDGRKACTARGVNEGVSPCVAVQSGAQWILDKSQGLWRRV